ncbi:DNA-binding protein Fis [Usitatibacter palustris]|uniref:Putative Fis-like DNA-binding protein n=2 Tax=Usitatibacter palustris TaxID=2732487 RepID=A0A6M4H678_9PROT|nr:DNA-binding protein Fis [Usitatibacter palustris]
MQPRTHTKSDARSDAAARENELSSMVRKVMKQYFKDLDGEKPCGIYSMVVNCVEKPMLEVVMNHAQGNQTRAAELLGINRNTLRKKLQEHGIE